MTLNDLEANFSHNCRQEYSEYYILLFLYATKTYNIFGMSKLALIRVKTFSAQNKVYELINPNL